MIYNAFKHFDINGNFKGKLYGESSTACVNNSSERDAADWRRRRAAEEDAGCVSQA